MTSIATGEHGGYSWLAIDDPRAFLTGLVCSAPSLVLGRTVVVTSFDSGPLSIDPKPGRDEGWISRHGLAASPRVGDPDTIPSGEFDEWYVFDEDQRPALDRLVGAEVFVNYHDFSADLGRSRPPTVDEETFRYSMERTERFWAQLARIKPEEELSRVVD